MPSDVLGSLLTIVKAVFRPELTRPSFARVLVLVVGWVQVMGPVHTITAALVATDVAGKRHHEAFHRFFSRGTWSPDALGFGLLRRLEKWRGDGPLRVVLDDTVAPKKGPHVFGIGTHLDAVRSTRRHRVFVFGHCWIVLALLVRVPFSHRAWALPILFRLYRNQKDCLRRNVPYRKKTELARELLDTLCRWTGERRIEVIADAAYCNDTITRELPARVVLFGAMRPDAVLTAMPPSGPSRPARGRPSKRGPVLPKPQAVAEVESNPWRRCKADLYGRITTVRYKTFDAQWYRACGTRLLRVVVVTTTSGAVPYRVFFCTDAALDVRTLLETYAERWGIEVFFRDAKQLLGFADSPARTANAVLRVAPFVGLLYSILVLWFAEGASTSPIAAPPVRPWYPHKRGLCFADILRTAQRASHDFDVLVSAPDFNNLPKCNTHPGSQEDPALHRAA
jgi:DDE superfamily endonuclease